MKNYSLFLIAALSLGGCSDDPATPGTGDAGADTPASDTGDAGPTDTGGDVVADASDPDSGDPDSGTPDSGDPDSGTPDSGDPDTGVEPGDCPAHLFVEADPDPANGAYEDPFLNAYCEDGELIVEANGIIGYEFVAMTPNDLAPQDWEYHIPLEPEWLDEPVDIALLGEVAVAINGVPIYGPNEGEFPDPYGDPVYNGIMDFCMGHTAQRGDYHYHALLVDCLTDATPAGEPDPIIGYSFDGYPIYGPNGCLDEACDDVVEFQSGWVQTGDPTTYAWDNHAFEASDDPTVLDRCNGRVGPDGTYRYHATATFPYILGCHHGEATGGNGGDGGVDPGPGDPPTSCTEEADCVGECFDGAVGCTCIDSPRDGMICVPTCSRDEDCEDGFECNTGGGFCVPAGGPPGGGGGAP